MCLHAGLVMQFEMFAANEQPPLLILAHWNPSQHTNTLNEKQNNNYGGKDQQDPTARVCQIRAVGSLHSLIREGWVAP
jgi:hypothetical protein